MHIIILMILALWAIIAVFFDVESDGLVLNRKRTFIVKMAIGVGIVYWIASRI